MPRPARPPRPGPAPRVVTGLVKSQARASPAIYRRAQRVIRGRGHMAEVRAHGGAAPTASPLELRSLIRDRGEEKLSR